MRGNMFSKYITDRCDKVLAMRVPRRVSPAYKKMLPPTVTANSTEMPPIAMGRNAEGPEPSAPLAGCEAEALAEAVDDAPVDADDTPDGAVSEGMRQRRRISEVRDALAKDEPHCCVRADPIEDVEIVEVAR